MPVFKPKMFEESSKSHASPNIWIQLAIFIVVFFIIFIFEAIIPSLLTVPRLMEELSTDQAFLNGAKKLTFDESMKMAERYSSLPEIMIPTLLTTAFGTLAGIFYCRCVEMRPLRSMGFRKRKALPHYLFGLAVGTLMMTAITLLTVLSGANSIKLCSEINFGLIGLYLLGFIVQGMSEEVIFRGYLMTTVGGHHNAFLAIGISSVAFGLAHSANPGINPLAMSNLILFGIFAALYIILFDDIWGACAIHSVWNFTQGNIYGISVSGSGNTESIFRTTAQSSYAFLTGGKFGIEGSIFTTIILAAGISFLIFRIKKITPENISSQSST
jgi:CAAX amino terminal protease family protein